MATNFNDPNVLDLTDKKIENLTDFMEAMYKAKEQALELTLVKLTPKQEMLLGCEIRGDEYYEMGSLFELYGMNIIRGYKSYITFNPEPKK